MNKTHRHLCGSNFNIVELLEPDADKILYNLWRPSPYELKRREWVRPQEKISKPEVKGRGAIRRPATPIPAETLNLAPMVWGGDCTFFGAADRAVVKADIPYCPLCGKLKVWRGPAHLFSDAVARHYPDEFIRWLAQRGGPCFRTFDEAFALYNTKIGGEEMGALG